MPKCDHKDVSGLVWGRMLAQWCRTCGAFRSHDTDPWRFPAVLTQLRWEAAPVHPIPMRLICPDCGGLHIDEGEFATKPHHTHSCQHCGLTWRPAVVATVGVRFLPGFRNEEK